MTSASVPEQCVILVGGLGSRLGALTGNLPKPLVTVGDRPFLAYLLWHLRRYGFRRVLLLAGHNSEAVVEFAVRSTWTEGLSVEVVVEPEPLGTAGAIRNALDRLDERFLFMNGDSLFDFNWLDLNELALQLPECRVAMALRHEGDASRFGVVTLDGERVTGFQERGTAAGGAINGGVYLLDRSVAAACPKAGSFERDVLPVLAVEGRVAGRIQQGFFLDIGIPDALAAAQTLVPASLRRGAVFFDRDGVLNVDHGYTHRWDEFEWIEGAVEAIKIANDRNLFAFLVTNQSGVARGYYDEAAVLQLHDQLQAHLRARGAHLDDIRYCPFHPDGIVAAYTAASDWRKPGAGMITDLAAHWPLDMSRSRLIGDQPSDLAAAAAAGVPATLFRGGRLDIAVLEMLKTIGPVSGAEGVQ